MKNLIIALCTVVCACVADGATWYVNPSGDNENPGTSRDLPKKTLSAAITAASAGETIWVSGALTVTSTVTINKDVQVLGEDGEASITGSGVCPLTLDSLNCVVSNLVISGQNVAGAAADKWNYSAAGVLVNQGHLTDCVVHNCTPKSGTHVCAVICQNTAESMAQTVSRCVITNNLAGTTTASYGAGLYMSTQGASAVVEDCEIAYNRGRAATFYVASGGASCVQRCDIHHNTLLKASELDSGVAASNGGGIRIDGGGFNWCRIHHNRSEDGGGGAWVRGGQLANCLISDNEAAGNGGGIFVNNQNPKLRNCTITGNTAGGNGAAISLESGTSSLSAVSTLAYGNGPDASKEISVASGTTAFTYCLLAVSWAGTGNVVAMGSPFVDAANGDYRTVPGSQAIDAGATSTTDVFDLEGNARVKDGNCDGVKRVDIGAYELTTGIYETFLSSTGGNIPPYDTPEKAARTLADAVVSLDDDQPRVVTLLPGEHAFGGLTVNVSAILRGAGPLGTVVITGGGTSTVLTVTCKDAVVSNLALRAGYTPGVTDSSISAGVLLTQGVMTHCEISGYRTRDGYSGTAVGLRGYSTESRPELRSCIVTNNVGYYGDVAASGWYPRGGGVYASDYSIVSNCEIAANTSWIGAGLSLQVASGSSQDNGHWPMAYGCLIRDNVGSSAPGVLMMNGHMHGCTIVSNRLEQKSGVTTSTGGGARIYQGDVDNCVVAFNLGTDATKGAGLALQGESTVTHCTVYGNRGANGVWCETGTGAAFANSIVWGTVNSAGTATADILRDAGSSPATVTYTCSGTSVPGAGNVQADPKLVNPQAGDFTLRLSSPCLDTASADYPASTGFDIRGEVRPLPGHEGVAALPDMGAFERRFLRRGLLIFVQ